MQTAGLPEGFNFILIKLVFYEFPEKVGFPTYFEGWKRKWVGEYRLRDSSFNILGIKDRLA